MRNFYSFEVVDRDFLKLHKLSIDRIDNVISFRSRAAATEIAESPFIFLVFAKHRTVPSDAEKYLF